MFWVYLTGASGSLGCMALIYLHKKLARYLVDPSGIFIMNFLITNLLLVVLQVPFSASSSFFGR